MSKTTWFIGLVGLSVIACNKTADEVKADPSPTAATKKAGDSAAAKPAEGTVTVGGPANAAATASPPSTPAAPAALPKGRTPVPTVDEWNAMTKEVTVKGSSALGCETKMVREYLRVSCRGKNDTGGKPQGIVLRKGMLENHIYIKGEIISLVVPYVEGINAIFSFTWSDTTHPLVLKWSRGAPLPQVLGNFEGAKSPLDGTAADTAMCSRCEKEVNTLGMSSAAFCEHMTSNKWCVSTYKNNCEKLKECGFGEPSAMVQCPSGTMRIAGGHYCATPCDAKKSCAAGFQCLEGMEDVPVCVEEI